MNLSAETKEIIFGFTIFAWLLLAAFSAAAVMDNVILGARLNALETVCKANLLIEKK